MQRQNACILVSSDLILMNKGLSESHWCYVLFTHMSVSQIDLLLVDSNKWQKIQINAVLYAVLHGRLFQPSMTGPEPLVGIYKVQYQWLQNKFLHKLAVHSTKSKNGWEWRAVFKGTYNPLKRGTIPQLSPHHPYHQPGAGCQNVVRDWCFGDSGHSVMLMVEMQ